MNFPLEIDKMSEKVYTMGIIIDEIDLEYKGSIFLMEPPTSNTYVFDPESPTEMARLINQDRAVTQAMGGPLLGITDPSSLHNILDLGSGPGGWALDAALARPEADIEGVDISRTMVSYANARARTQQLPNASFGVMDLTQPLEFPDASFDLVSGRYLFPVLKRDVWSPFLSECTRVLRPGGILRLSESLNFGHTSSAAFNRLGSLIMQAFCQEGYGFSPDGLTFGVDHILPTLVRQQGYQPVQLMAHPIDFTAFSADTYHNVEIIGYQVKPRLIKLGLITSEAFDELLQQTLIDILSETFCGLGYLFTVLGHKPPAS